MLRLIIIATLCLTGCASTVKDPLCAAGTRYTSGPHAGHCWMP